MMHWGQHPPEKALGLVTNSIQDIGHLGLNSATFFLNLVQQIGMWRRSGKRWRGQLGWRKFIYGHGPHGHGECRG